MFGVAEFTTGGNSPTGPKLGSGRLSNGLIISGIPSSDKGTSNNLDLISPITGAAASKGLGKSLKTHFKQPIIS